MSHLPAFIAPLRFRDPAAALAQVRAIYDQQIAHLRDAMQRYVGGETLPGHVRACYPFVRIHTDTVARAILETPDIKQLSYGFVAGPGRYETTLTRPDLYSEYYLEQFRLLLKNHRCPGRLFAAASAPLHRYLARVVPELRAVHQLPVLHRRVRAHGP